MIFVFPIPKMRKIFSLILFCIISLTLKAQNNDALNYIKQNAIPIDTGINTDGYSDLMPLIPTLQNRRLIGMGEATHGTHEFQVVKFRMLKFLAEKMGYRLFGIEANFTECRKVNDYVLYGKGDARTAIKGTYFWTWTTKEVVQMIEWMHTYNLNKPDTDKVKFYGFDMQVGKIASGLVAEKLKKVDSNYYYTHFKVLDTLNITVKKGFAKFSKDGVDSIKTLIANIKTYINDNNTALLKLYSTEDIAYLKRDVRLIEQCMDMDLEYYKHGYWTKYGSFVRQQCMAENVEWILDNEGPNSKMMIWAHNIHIGKTDMGSYLKKKYKDQYYAIGFDFNKGTFRAVDIVDHKGLTNFTIGDAEPGSSGNIFSQFNITAFFFDIESTVKTNSPAKPFFTKPLRHRSISAGYGSKWEANMYLPEPLYGYFDGLIFINDTTPTQAM
jgi:erythromycin esterase